MARRQLSAVVDQPVVALCAGKDCRKRCEFSKIRKALDDHCEVVEMKCVGICKGPVVVAHLDADEPLVLAQVRSKKQRRQFVAAVTGDSEPSKELRSLQVSGKKRASTARRARLAVAKSA